VTWDEKVRALAADPRSPSSALALRAADILRDQARDDPELLAEAARAIVRAQPALAAVVNVANVALRTVEVLGLGSVSKALDTLREGIEADRHAAAAALVGTLESPVTLVTSSANVVVAEAIQALHRHALLERVVCAESRPLLEGTAFARWLASQGCPTALVPDAGLAEHLRPGALFVVGTEAILPQQVVHRLGTRLHAAWACLAGVPRYVLATRDKVYPRELLPHFAVPMLPVTELLREPPAGLQAEARAFDLTPHSLWTEIFVGGAPAALAVQKGDHRLARGLLQLVP
jgi:translation initiation factor 2B subunit (eIF-2B alpha/beta/delta family)